MRHTEMGMEMLTKQLLSIHLNDVDGNFDLQMY